MEVAMEEFKSPVNAGTDPAALRLGVRFQ